MDRQSRGAVSIAMEKKCTECFGIARRGAAKMCIGNGKKRQALELISQVLF